MFVHKCVCTFMLLKEKKNYSLVYNRHDTINTNYVRQLNTFCIY